MPRVTCPKCKAADMVHSDGGTAVCTNCGCVLDENPIVSEITWTEEPGGASSVVGQFISSTGTKVFRKGGPGGHAKESREVTIENGRKKIAQIAGGLKLKQHHIEAAQRLFMLAVQHNFIQGRKTQNVVAACLYIVCRREKTPHMLIDFSDILQTNVYVLGHTYLRFCKRLNLQLPIIDPSLYIPRFCGKLEFEEKAQMVANTALRLVQRMRRDWIQTGRRPSGICGAALLISARLHGFKRTQKEIIQVVRICDVTLRKRLQEFAQTPSSNLTHEDFEVIEIEEECDPPAFTRARKSEKRIEKDKAEKEKEKAAEEEEGGEKAEKATAELEKEMTEYSAEVQQVAANPTALLQQDLQHDPNDFTDLNDDELDRYLHDDDEVKAKTAIWTEINKEYLAAQEEKEREEAANIAAGKAPQKKKKRRRDTRKDQPIEPGTAGASAAEATMEMLRKRAPSQAQINPQALTQLFTLPERLQRPTKKVPVAPARAVVPTAPVVSTAMASSMEDVEGPMPHDVGSEPAYAWEGEDEYAPYWEAD